jgi:hypothetical protein
MNSGKNRLRNSCACAVPAMLLAGCSRAPSVDILGSFFPAWLVCFAIAVVLTGVARVLLVKFKVKVELPVLVYPSLTALFTFALWLIFFR